MLYWLQIEVCVCVYVNTPRDFWKGSKFFLIFVLYVSQGVFITFLLLVGGDKPNGPPVWPSSFHLARPNS